MTEIDATTRRIRAYCRWVKWRLTKRLPNRWGQPVIPSRYQDMGTLEDHMLAHEITFDLAGNTRASTRITKD